MSLNDKWKEYRATLQLRSDEQERLLREAFYTGAEAAQSLVGDSYTKFLEIQAEIDHFRSHK